MTHTPKSIEAQALQLIRDADITKAPVDVTSVAKLLGARVHIEQLEDDISGVLIVKGNEKHVLVNKKHAGNRQRFTIGHEIGHLVLHATSDRMIVDTNQIRVFQRVGQAASAIYNQAGSETTPEEEREANLFSAAILMPEPMLKAAAVSHDLSDETEIASLAKEFGVSEQAMFIRLQQLRIIESVFSSSQRQATLV